MGFGKLLKEKMQLRNIKQSELSTALGIPKTTLSSMINRDNMKVDIEMLLKICDYLECDPEDFYKDYYNHKNLKSNFLTAEESTLLNMFRAIDNYGKNTVSLVCKSEYERCQSQKKDM